MKHLSRPIVLCLAATLCLGCDAGLAGDDGRDLRLEVVNPPGGPVAVDIDRYRGDPGPVEGRQGSLVGGEAAGQDQTREKGLALLIEADAMGLVYCAIIGLSCF